MVLANIRSNHLANVTRLNLALSKKVGNGTMYISDSPARHSLVYVYPRRRAIGVRVPTLDEVIRQYALDKVDLAKIDVEGSEFDLIDGAKRFLSKSNAKLIIETSDRERLKAAPEPFDYQISNIDTTNFSCVKVS